MYRETQRKEKEDRKSWNIFSPLSLSLSFLQESFKKFALSVSLNEFYELVVIHSPPFSVLLPKSEKENRVSVRIN